MDFQEKEILLSRLIPVPQSIDFPDGANFQLSNHSKFVLQLPAGKDFTPLARKSAQDYWGITPDITIQAMTEVLPDEAYNITVNAKQLTIATCSQSGLQNAFKTLRQLAEVERGSAALQGYFLVPTVIADAPAASFRGIHLCVFPETPLWELEKNLRLAAYHKYNYAVIEFWGVFPFKSHPELGWSESQLDAAALKKLIRQAPDWGITLIPQFNLLGHASQGRSITGKHAVLDRNPRLQPLFEPEGWSWCLSNPHTRQLLTDVVLELYDFFDRPPFFHIGCDEADNIGTCQTCRRQNLRQLIGNHIRYFHDLLTARHCQVIMWHDMLLQSGDPRWTNYIVCGLPEHHLAELYQDLPRDIVIADWQYGYPQQNPDDPEPDWPTMKFFQSEKFAVLGCPWRNASGIVSIGKFIEQEHLFGMLETTWHLHHGRDYLNEFGVAPCAAWNPQRICGRPIVFRLAVAHHLRQIGWDLELTDYEAAGWSHTQVNPGHTWD